MMVPVSLRSCGAVCLFGMCVLGQAFAFVAPSGRGATSVGSAASSASALVRTSKATSPIVMRASGSPAEAAVERFKQSVGRTRWAAMDSPDENATGVFEEIASIYGEENATEMVKAVPGCLGFDPSIFRATFEAFSEVFTAEDTKGMVTRNPNLLAVRPTGFGGACNAKSDTMTMSYIIAYTRPLGPVLLFSLFLLLSIPAIEITTGIPRDQLLSALISQASG